MEKIEKKIAFAWKTFKHPSDTQTCSTRKKKEVASLDKTLCLVVKNTLTDNLVVDILLIVAIVANTTTQLAFPNTWMRLTNKF